MKNAKGFALGTVMILITVFVLLGVALLSFAQGNAQQSALVNEADNNYYAAESAAQVAAQVLVRALGVNGVLDSAIPSDENSVKGEIQTLYADALEAGGMIAAPIGGTTDFPSERDYNHVDGGEIHFNEINLDYPSQAEINALPSGAPIPFSIEVPVTAGMREVSLWVDATIQRTSPYSQSYFNPVQVRRNPDGTVKKDVYDVETQQEADDKEGTYDDFMTALDKLNYDPSNPSNPNTLTYKYSTAIGEASQKPVNKTYKTYKEFDTDADIIRPRPSNASDLDGFTHLWLDRSNEPLQDGTYKDLEYIYCAGNLHLQGEYIFPKLKGIICTANSSLVITTETAGETTTLDIESASCFIGGWGSIFLNAPDTTLETFTGARGKLEIYNCIFYNPNGTINFNYFKTWIPHPYNTINYTDGGYDIITNSLFYTEDTLNFNGPVGENFDKSTPQFYHNPPDTRLEESGLANFNYMNRFNGIFITSSKLSLFDSATPPTELSGLFVANCKNLSGISPVDTPVTPIKGEVFLENDPILSGITGVAASGGGSSGVTFTPLSLSVQELP